jgi:threonine dehydratase
MFTSLLAAAAAADDDDDVIGGIEAGAVTFEPCQQLVDTWVTVTEQEIADAVVSMLHHHSKLVEGAAGCAIAAVKKLGQQLVGKRVVVVCCGGNVALPTLKKVLDMGRVWG